ncbi:Uncharacterized protein HZ326_12685 [Fusarium oxysporum f. sp. albedinis]|nr:Uncharacterized protein HZ326_12685 [Fusarium oxysporum f. sp. albedinis]
MTPGRAKMAFRTGLPGLLSRVVIGSRGLISISEQIRSCRHALPSLRQDKLMSWLPRTVTMYSSRRPDR